METLETSILIHILKNSWCPYEAQHKLIDLLGP